MASRKLEKEQRRAERQRAEAEAEASERRKKLFVGAGAAGLAALVVVVALIAVSQSSDDDGGGGVVAQSAVVNAQLDDYAQSGTVLGDPKAEVTIVEFGDLQCPACKSFSESVLPEVLAGPVADGDAKIEFRNFTIIGPESVEAAKGALAASEQDRYWNFVEIFYANQPPENSGEVTDQFLADIAAAAEVADLDAWEAARANPAWDRRLADIESQAAAAGFRGTPSILVEGPGGTEALGSVASAAEIEAAVKRVR